jgi:hypothetical protein
MDLFKTPFHRILVLDVMRSTKYLIRPSVTELFAGVGKNLVLKTASDNEVFSGIYPQLFHIISRVEYLVVLVRVYNSDQDYGFIRYFYL